MEKPENSNNNDILNQEFFDTIKNSKKINTKTQKIKELSKYFSSNLESPQSPEIKNKIPELYELLLINLNENNNNYVLAQMDLIQVLGKAMKEDENYNNFIRQSLPKLFDKFYLGNTKINEVLVKMFSEFIAYKILTIKDYYQYIENIPLEEEDNYRINILNFLYENIDKDKTVLLNNIPKSLNELIKKLVNDNESDISETASKILNILINRDIESNKKKDNSIPESKNDEKNKEDKGGTGISTFVNNIVTVIKQNVDNTDNKDNNIDNYNKDNNVNNIDQNAENINKTNSEENKKESEEKNEINDVVQKEEIIQKDKLEEIKSDDKTQEEKKETKIAEDKKEVKEEEKSNEVKGDINSNVKEDENNNEKKKEKNIEKIYKKEEKEKIETIIEEKKEEEKEIKNEEKKDEIKEEKNGEIIEGKKDEIKEENKDLNDVDNKKEINSEEKIIDNKEIIKQEDKKEEKPEEKKENIKDISKDNINEVKSEEKPKETIPNIPETKNEGNVIDNNEKLLENNEKNSNIENMENINNKENKIENKVEEKEENKKPEIIKEEPNKNEIKTEPKISTNEEIKSDNNPVIEKKEEPKKELDEIKKEETKEIKKEETKEIKKDETKEENKVAQVKPIDTNNINEEKKEKEKQDLDKINQEEKKENIDEKKRENKEKTKTTDNKKKSGGIKSKISKFRKNKNKNKDGGFEFELVMDKKKENPPEDNKEPLQEKEQIKEDTIKEKENIEDKKIEEKQIEGKKLDINDKKPEEENKKVEEKAKEEKKEEKIEEDKKEKPKEENKEEKIEEDKKEKPKEEMKEKKQNEEEELINPIKEEKVTINKEGIINEKPKEEIKPIEPKLDIIKEEKSEEEIQNPEKPIEPNKKEEQKIYQNAEQESKPLPNTEEKKEQNNPPVQSQEIKEEKIEEKSKGINQESLNEFEKKLQLALEQEAKDKNNNENLVESTPMPIKQKKEDPKFDEIKSVLGKEIVDSLFSPKWEMKKHGFELINEFINSKPKESYNIGDLIEYMKLKLKNYKETNFNITREAINVYINMIKKKIIPKDSLTSIIIAYHEKLSDIKLKDNIIELINNSFDIIEPTNILKQIITKISKKNNAKLLIEYATFFGNVVEEYDVKDLPNKDIIDFCKVLANNSNPQVRTSAISLLCILYKYLGKDVKTLTRDIKESTLKLIDAELDKVKVIDPKETLSKKKKAASVIENGGTKSGAGGKSKDLIPPQDISKKITPQIIKLLSSPKWAEKKEACDSIEKILISANMRILPNGLNTLMTNIKKKLSDSNKNFVRMLVSLLSKLIEAMKSGFKQWAKPIALVLIPNLADKNQLMRNECQNCFDKWVEFAGLESLVVHFPKFLTTDNVEMRIEIMNFFMKNKDKFNKSIGESVYKDMMNPLLICLQDRSSNVRNLSEEIIKISLVYNPLSNYYKKIEDFKPAIAKTLKQILDKIKQETSSNESKQENNPPQEPENNTISNHSNTEQTSNSNNNNNNPTNINKTNEKATKNINIKSSNKKLSIQTSETSLKTESSAQDDSEKNESTTEDNISNFNTIANIKSSKKDPNARTTKKLQTAINSKRAKPKRKLSEDDLVNPLGTAMNKQMPASSVEHLASNSTILRKKEFKSFQKNPSQVVKTTNAVFLINVKVIPNKAKRYDKDKRTKFNLETVSKDYFIKLKEQCKGLFTEPFAKKIFSDDFRKQVEAFKDMKGQIDKKINIPIYFDNLDLILKIIGIKILNNLNPTLMKNFFEFLDSLYQVLFENKYKINETESNIIISLLIDKLSLNNNTLREHLLSLLNKYIEFMDTNKIMVTVINVALNKNNKIKTDILDLTIDLVSQDKLNISTKTYAKLLCRFLPFYENVIRTKTLTLFQEIYSNIGNELWNMIEISEKDKEFLEENLCVDDEEEDEEREGEEEEDDEEGNDEINNEIEKENEGNKNEINVGDKKDNSADDSKAVKKDSEKAKIFGSKNGPLSKEDLDAILDNLLIDDPNEKLNTIILIHENICGKFEQNKEVLIPNIDKIITTFKVVSHKLFYMKDLNSIPIKFAKYLSIVFCKLASNKELISNLSYNVLLDLSRELLRYLLINGLDRIGDQQEGNIIFKSINSTMLRILENCDITFVITALLELIKEFQEKDDKNLVSLAIKCLLKTTHNLSENIDKVDISKILLQIHLLLLSLQKNNKDLNKKTQNTVLIINTVKSIVGDFVKLKKEKVLEEYSKSVKNHQINDKFLLKWIKAALEKV